MPNTWHYGLVFKEQNISEEMFAAIIQIVNSFGYSVWTPKTFCEIEPNSQDVSDALYAASFFGPQRIIGICHDGMDELEFKDFETAKDTLLTKGGLITLWNEPENDWYPDIDIVFNPTGELSLGVTYDLGKYDQDDVQRARDLKGLFVALCKRLEPVYGYSRDEWRLEAAFSEKDLVKEWERFERAIRNLDPPPILFWLNYFSSSYLDRIGDLSLESVPHNREDVPGGAFIYLAEHPWEAPIPIVRSE